MRACGGRCSRISTEVMSPWCRAMMPVSSCNTPARESAVSSTPVFSAIAGLRVLEGHFVFAQQIFPVSLRFEKQFDDLAHRALAARGSGNVLRAALYLGPRIGRRYGQPHAVHHHDISEVVAHVGDLLRLDSRCREDFLKNRN